MAMRERLTEEQKKEVDRISKLPLGTWATDLKIFCEKHDQNYGSVYAKANKIYKERMGIQYVGTNKSKGTKRYHKNKKANATIKTIPRKKKKYKPYTRKTHTSPLHRNTPLEITQTQLRFPIENISIETNEHGGFDFIVYLK